MTDNNYPIKARVWLRESTQEWVLELDGAINDTIFNIRYTEPITTRPEDVPGASLDRIEELEKRCSAYARADQLFVEEINELEAKLTKAVETLQILKPLLGDSWVDRRVLAVLAGLEGK